MCMYIRVTNQMHGEELLCWTGCSELLTDVSVPELTCTVLHILMRPFTGSMQEVI